MIAAIDLSPYAYAVAPNPAEDGGGFIVSFVDVPGCYGLGATEEDAVADGQEALFACLDALRAADRPFPKPKA